MSDDKKATTATTVQEHKDHEGNQIWVSSQKRISFYADLALKMMVTNEQIQLHGLGAAIASAVELSQYLLHNKRAILTKVYTSTVQSGPSRKPEIVIHMTRTGIPVIPQQTNTADEEALEAFVDKIQGNDD